MKHYYKTVALIGLITCGALQVKAQTHYGSPVGTTGDGHAFFGVQAGASNQGAQNTFIGSYSGQFHSNGGKNTFLGFQSGQSHSIGGNNTLIGAVAGRSSEGENNVLIGSNAGEYLLSNNNTFIGTAAGQNHKTGANNIFVGQLSGQNHATGDDNMFIGVGAGKSAQGSTNVFLGNKSGEKYIGDRTILMGQGSGIIGGGVDNVLIGWGSGYSAKGNGNVMLGSWSGGFQLISASLDNTFVGSQSGLYNLDSRSNSFFGADAGYLNKTGSFNAFIGDGAGYLNEAGHYNAFFGFHSGSTNSTGEYNTYLGAHAGGKPTLKYATAIGALSMVTKDHAIVLGGATDFVGIGISAPAYKLQLGTNSAAKPGSSSWTVASDKRLKKDISDYAEGLGVLKQIKPVWFRYNGEAGMPTDKKFVGIIAQDMQKIAPHTVGTFTYQDSLGNKTEFLDYDANAITYMLVNSVKEQQQIIEEKESKIQELSSQVDDLAKRLAQLERIVVSNMTKPLTTNPAARLDGEPNQNGVILEQNAPNGFSGNTSIDFFIPPTIKEAVLNVYATDGIKLFSKKIAARGQGAVELSATDFGNGIFIYDLVTDGRSNGAKKMMVQK